MAGYNNGPHSTSSFPSPPPESYYDGSDYGTSYNNYSDHFTDPLPCIDENSYDNYRLIARSGLGHKRASGQFEAFGSRLLSAVSDATTPSLSRRSSQHARAKSLATYVPSLAGSATQETPSYKTPMRRFGSLLSGSAPASPSQEDPEETEYIMDYKPSLTSTPERSINSPRRIRPSRTDSSPSRSGLSNWFGAKKEAPPPPQVALELEDPLLNLNITTQLFPYGAVDPLSPGSFNDLLLNAESLITRLQSGYKEHVALLRTARAEREAQVEEVEEAETRAQHLKLQLEQMAAKAADQDRAMQTLADELAVEKLARQELIAKQYSPRPVLRRDRADSARFSHPGDGEDDITPRRAVKVVHRTSEGLASDSGFESDAESASTFSGPATPMSPQRVAVAMAGDEQSWEARDMTPKNLDADFARSPRIGPAGQSGGVFRQSEAGAWSLVPSLRQENYRLTGRVNDLEGAVEGCLGIVGGL